MAVAALSSRFVCPPSPSQQLVSGWASDPCGEELEVLIR
jgi:hypothetical protein